MLKERNESLDIARGIGMIGVILIHMEFVGLYPACAAFCVPIFFLISGYLTRPAADLKKYILKRAKQLMLPYAFTCTVIIVLAFALSLMLADAASPGETLIKWAYAALYGAGDEYTSPFYIPSIGAIWFLWASLWGMILLQLVLKIAKVMWQSFAVLAIFLVGLITARFIWLPFSIQAGMCAAGFMYIGYEVRELFPMYVTWRGELKAMLLAGCAVAYGLFCYFFEGFWLVHCEIAHGPLDIIGSLAGCVLVMAVSELIARRGRLSKRVLAAIGRYSLVVLCMHIIELDIFPWDAVCAVMVSAGISQYLAWNVIVRLLKVTWIALASTACVKSPVARRIFSIKD